MSYSRRQIEKKMEAQKESMHYRDNMNVTGMRSDGPADELRGKGMYHQTEAEEALEHGYPVKTVESC